MKTEQGESPKKETHFRYRIIISLQNLISIQFGEEYAVISRQ